MFSTGRILKSKEGEYIERLYLALKREDLFHRRHDGV